MTYSWLEAQEPTIIYIGDPMCSWCYGFAPEIEKVKKAFPDHGFEVVLGGLRPGGTETMEELGEFLEHHWKEVQSRSGQPINYDIIGDPTFILDTEPGCRAVVTARMMDSAITLDFFREVQSAFYVGNKDMTSIETFLEVARSFELDENEFRRLYEDEETKYTTRSDFQLAAEMGIKGFPSVVVRHKDQLYLAANGYRKAEDLVQTIRKIQEE